MTRNAYRHVPPERSTDIGEPAVVRTYLDPVEAEMARTHLGSHGIHATVLEVTSFNPALTGAAGGIRLQVAASDAEQASDLLAQLEATPEAADDEVAAVRCPRCELEYCSLERERLGAAAGHPFAVVLAVPAALLSKKRWRCHKCEHVWDDPAEGPRTRTPALPGDPRPVFRLRRARAGMGLFLGFLAGSFAALVANHVAGPLVLVGLTLVGWVAGRAMIHLVCSEPTCRARLGRDTERCPRCKGEVEGDIDRATEHFAGVADVRRRRAARRRLAAARADKKKTLARRKARPAALPDA